MSETISYTGTIAIYTVASTADYTITADGADGGNATHYAATGGDGASVTGAFDLSQGDVIEIIIGGAGGSGFGAGGGGGGTFIFDKTTGTLLEVAGGGGGSGVRNVGDAGQAGMAGSAGTDSAVDGSPGTNGGGGGGGDYDGLGGGGGGGYLTSGGNGGNGVGKGGAGFNEGGAGGGGSNGALGGFGGGGGGDILGGGGGGGYSGGSGAGVNYAGGGGGSYVDSSATGASETAGGNTTETNGFVTFTPALCYLRGTHILTPTGERRIEDFKIGDLVVTRFSGIRPIIWIGRQNFAPEDTKNWPIRIRAAALSHHTPAHDLCVSPGHSILLNGQLILAEFLVNGVTITRDPSATRIEYFNLDLGAHDCIIAEGAFSETFADAETLREKFSNVAEYYALYPDEPPPEELILCAPRPEQGEALNAALRPVAARAAALVQPGTLEGYIEKIIDDWYISGWAHDPAHPFMPVLLEVCAGGNVIGNILACDPREDLATAGKGSGRCAFTFKSPIRLKPEILAGLTLRRAADGAELPINPQIRPEPAPETRRLRLVE